MLILVPAGPLAQPTRGRVIVARVPATMPRAPVRINAAGLGWRVCIPLPPYRENRS